MHGVLNSLLPALVKLVSLSLIHYRLEANIKLPSGLSQKLTETLGVRGKTLGLCIAQCREAILDEYLSESDDCDCFVDWVRNHFDAHQNEKL